MRGCPGAMFNPWLIIQTRKFRVKISEDSSPRQPDRIFISQQWRVDFNNYENNDRVLISFESENIRRIPN